MELTLYMAISIDGNIAYENWDSSFVSPLDEKIFWEIIQWSDAVLIGRKTYEQYLWEIYPIPNKINIVISTSEYEMLPEQQTYFAQSPEEAMQIAQEHKCRNLLLVWWWHINSSFFSKNLINEIILDIHPLILWKGIWLFEWTFQEQIPFEIKEINNIWENQILIKYKRRS